MVRADIQEAPVSCAIESISTPFCLVIFGASGDLTSRKLIPSLFRLYSNNILPHNFLIIGTARSELTVQDFRKQTREWLEKEDKNIIDIKKWDTFSERLYYKGIQYDNKNMYKEFTEQLENLEKKHETKGNRLFYLATPPGMYEIIIENLGLSNLSNSTNGFTRIVIEKPFGRDLASAKKLNEHLLKYFNEEQIYRIDHYLGKETVQNILLFRFANSIFEPLWNKNFIDHVQITVAESLGIEHRAGYYDKSGVLRDMFQNHMLQLLALIVMEPPNLYDSQHVRDEKVKVFQALRSIEAATLSDCLVFGQYQQADIDGEKILSYRDERGVDPHSLTPTYVAMKIFIDNWRWQDVPFYLRTGKRLRKKISEISIHFKKAPDHMFKKHPIDIVPNVLSFVIQPEEEIIWRIMTKVPGAKNCLRDAGLRFSYKDHYSFLSLEAYERVLIDCLLGDQLLFVRQDGIELTWSFLAPALSMMDSSEKLQSAIRHYTAGSWGPWEANELIMRDGRGWKISN